MGVALVITRLTIRLIFCTTTPPDRLGWKVLVSRLGVPVEEKSKRGKLALIPEPRRQRQLLLSQLVYEMEDEKPVYYTGYQDVLNGSLELEAIIGSSGLKSFLMEIIQRFLFLHPLRSQFRILSSQLGVQLSKKKWRICDIALYDKARLKDIPVANKYMPLAPDYVIEIDTKADLTKYQYQHDYFIKKTRELHESGVKKVIWIFTENIPVIWESDSANAIIIRDGWNHDVTITEGMTFNLATLYANAEKD